MAENLIPRPIWSSVESYPEDLADWEYRRWAWEFLRRNLEYQEESSAALSAGSPALVKSVARRYGLRDLVHFKKGYVPGDPAFVWLSETFCKSALVGSRQTNLRLQAGEVALVFDLDSTLASGPAAIDAMLYNAKRILQEQRQVYINSLEDHPERVRVKTPKIHKAKLFIWLRVYDAIVHSNVSRLEAAKVLYPGIFKSDKFTLATKERKARKKISAAFSEAKTLVKDKYRALPPLDYLQDKSKKMRSNPK